MAKQRRTRPLWIDLALLAVVVAIFAIPLTLRLNTDGQPEGEAYAGTDSSATEKIEELNPDYTPWFNPLFEASSGEVESGLFALQAAVGAGTLGFVLGRLSGRRRTRQVSATASDAEGP